MTQKTPENITCSGSGWDRVHENGRAGNGCTSDRASDHADRVDDRQAEHERDFVEFATGVIRTETYRTRIGVRVTRDRAIWRARSPTGAVDLSRSQEAALIAS